MSSPRVQTNLNHQKNNRTIWNMDYSTSTKHGEQLFKTGLFSDCTVYCNDRTWPLHRAILAPRCDFFKACFTLGFRESTSQGDSHNGIIATEPKRGISVCMHDDDPKALNRLLEWLYTFTYPSLLDTNQPVPDTDNAICPLPTDFWTSELELCTIADKYNLIPLSHNAATSILDAARTHISDPSSSRHNETFVATLDKFTEMLEAVFSGDTLPASLPQDFQTELLEITADMIAKHISQEHQLSELLTAAPAFAVTLIQVLGGSSSSSDSDPEAGHGNIETSWHVSTPSHQIPAINLDHEASAQRYASSSRSDSSRSSVSDAEPPRYRRRRSPRNSKKAGSNDEEHDGLVATVPRKVHVPMNEDSDLD